jgi:WD40 repeat protein
MKKHVLTSLALGLTFGLSVTTLPASFGAEVNSQKSTDSQKQSGTKFQEIRIYQGHGLVGESLLRIVYSRNGQLILSSGSDGMAKIFTPDGKLIREFNGKPFAMHFSGTFSFDGKRFVTSGYDGIARIWDMNGKVVSELKGHSSGVTDAIILNDGGTVSSSDDGTVLFFAANGKQINKVEEPGVSRRMDISPDGNVIAVSQDIGTITLLTPAGKFVRQIKTEQGRLNDLHFSPDGKYVVSAGFDGTARVFSLDGKQVDVLKVLKNGWVTGAVMNKNNLIATVSDDGILRLWDLKANLLDSYNPNLGRLATVAFSPNGKDLTIGAYNGTFVHLQLK